MPFTVWCNIDGCSFEETEVPTVDDVLDLHDAHTARFGDVHALEFERILASTDAEDD